MNSPDLASLLLLAREAEVGISIITNNPALLKNKLYAERKRHGFTDLSIIQPPSQTESRLWIVKKEARPNGSDQD